MVKITEMCRLVKLGELIKKFAENIKRLLESIIALMKSMMKKLTVDNLKKIDVGDALDNAVDIVKDKLDDIGLDNAADAIKDKLDDFKFW